MGQKRASDLFLSLSSKIERERERGRRIIGLSFFDSCYCTSIRTSLFHLALHARINSLLAHFKVSFHSAIFARARLVSGLSRFFFKKKNIYYEVIRRYSHAPQGCQPFFLSLGYSSSTYTHDTTVKTCLRAIFFSIHTSTRISFNIEKCYYVFTRI